MNFNFNFSNFCDKTKQTEQSAVNGNIGRGERNNEAIILIMRHRAIILFGDMLSFCFSLVSCTAHER
jgi:hypothetical protein